MKNIRVPMAVTAKQKVLPYLIKYQARFGFAPTNREVAKFMKMKSAYSGNLYISALEDAKLIKVPRTKFGRAKSRIIEILKTN